MTNSEAGRKGGRIGGKRRLITMSAEERSESAYNAAVARWSRMTDAQRKAWRANRDEKARARKRDEKARAKKRGA